MSYEKTIERCEELAKYAHKIGEVEVADASRRIAEGFKRIGKLPGEDQ